MERHVQRSVSDPGIIKIVLGGTVFRWVAPYFAAPYFAAPVFAASVFASPWVAPVFARRLSRSGGHSMRYLVLACDFDGTVAHEGIVDESVVEALARCRASGRRLILVTGRELADLTRT